MKSICKEGSSMNNRNFLPAFGQGCPKSVRGSQLMIIAEMPMVIGSVRAVSAVGANCPRTGAFTLPLPLRQPCRPHGVSLGELNSFFLIFKNALTALTALTEPITIGISLIVFPRPILDSPDRGASGPPRWLRQFSLTRRRLARRVKCQAM